MHKNMSKIYKKYPPGKTPKHQNTYESYAKLFQSNYCQEWEIDELLRFCMHKFIFLIIVPVCKAKHSTKICPLLEGVDIK